MGIPDHLTCLLRNLYAGQEATLRTGHGTKNWLQIGKGVHQICILSPCLFNLYAEYIMRNARLGEAQAGIKIAGRNINNLRYADDTTFMAENEELKSLFSSMQFSSVAQSCPTLCNPMDCSMPGLPVHHQLLEFTKLMSIESMMPSNHCILCRSLLLPPSILPWLHLFILSEVISPLISSSILGTYQPGEFIFQCPIFLPVHTVDGVLKARILKLFAIPFSSGPHFVRTLHHDPSVFGGPTQHGS